MTKLISLLAAFLSLGTAVFADTIAIKNPGYFNSPIRDGHAVFPDTLYFDSEAEELVFPDMGTFVKLGNYPFPNLRKVTLGNVDYMPGCSFAGMEKLEEIVVNGMVGHFDCWFVGHCPKLRKVTFNGPISSTGGPSFKQDCPRLENVEFNGLVIEFGLDSFRSDNTPEFKNYTINGAIISSYNDSLTPVSDIDRIKNNPRFIEDAKTLAKWQAQVMTAKGDNKWMRKCAYEGAKTLLPVFTELGCFSAADSLKAAMDFAYNHGDEVKTYLEILKDSPAYAADTLNNLQFTYVLPSDSMLTETRTHFNLDSIAGTGNDISRIKNLLYWVHNNIRHDGSNGFPDGPRNLKNIYYSALRDTCGYNCRALAISLTEALLAEGIPARYLTCEYKHWDSDNDCHVICVAWSESLNKWIWVDPTFAAFVTDENGIMLHPGEVRHRLQHDLPLALNPDANWNNLEPETKEEYLDEYMAKNLYIISSNMLNQAEPEGRSNHVQGYIAALVPQGSNYKNARYLTTDPDKFWHSPAHWMKQSKPKSEIKIK